MQKFYVKVRVPAVIEVEAINQDDAQEKAELIFNPEWRQTGDVEILNPLAATTSQEQSRRGALIAKIFQLVRTNYPKKGLITAKGIMTDKSVYSIVKKIIEEGAV